MWLKGNNLIILKFIWDKPLLDGHHPDEGTTLLRPENEMSHENARENWDMPNNNNNSRRLLEEGGAMPIIKPATSPLRWRSVTLYGPFDLITRGRASVCLFWFIRFLTGKSGGNDYKESKFWEEEECVRESWPEWWGGEEDWTDGCTRQATGRTTDRWRHKENTRKRMIKTTTRWIRREQEQNKNNKNNNENTCKDASFFTHFTTHPFICKFSFLVFGHNLYTTL